MTATNSPAHDNACSDCGEIHDGHMRSSLSPGFPIAVTPEARALWRGPMTEMADSTMRDLEDLERTDNIIPVSALHIVHMSDDTVHLRSNGSPVQTAPAMYRNLAKACEETATLLRERADKEDQITGSQDDFVKTLLELLTRGR